MKTLVQFLSLSILHAATTVDVSPTATQALIRIHTDQPGSCTFRASEGAVIGTPVYDVDATKFPGSNSDARPGSVVGAEHIFVLGARTAARATNGKWYSRALQANAQHTIEVTCGADVVIQSFSTLNPPLGDIAGETLPFDPAAPYNAAFPSIDMSMTNGLDTGQATKYIDPLTGIQAVRVTGSMQGASIFSINPGTPPTAFDDATAWTTPLNSVGNAGFATIGTAGQANALFIPFGLPEAVNYIPFGEWDGMHQMDDLNFSVNCSGSSAAVADRTMSACIGLHHGMACDTDTVTFVCPQNTPAVVVFPGATATAWNPFWKLWTTTNPYPAPVDLGTRTGTATSVGQTVTWNSGALFSNRWVAGDRFKLAGSGCGNGGVDYCTIASVTDSRHLIIAETANVGPAAFTVQNAGMRIWKNNATGSVSLNTSQYYAAFGMDYGTSVNEQKDTCSPNTFSLIANRDGSARSPGLAARLCQFQAGDARHAVYVWVPSTGEAWHVANGATVYPGLGGVDGTNSGGVCSQQAPAWHPSDPFSWYCVGSSGVGPYFNVVYHFTYNYAAGAGSCNGREWNDTTYGMVFENPCVGIVNDTPASANKDLITLFKAFDPSFDSAYFPTMTFTGGIGKYLVFTFTTGSQNNMAYYGWYDVLLKNFVKSADTFRTFPLRWGTSHGNSLIHNTDSTWSVVQVNSEQCFRGQCTGNDLSEMAIVSITGRGDNNLPSNYFTACPAGLDARWQALGATAGAMNCVQITMDGEPRMENPSAADKAKWPVSVLNPAWTQIQPIAEGDEIADNGLGTYTERMLVVKKTAGSGNQIILDLLRSPQWVGIGTCGTPVDHTAPWVPVMHPPGQCNTGSEYWVNIAGNATAIPETFTIGGSHSDSSGIGPSGGIVSASGFGRLGAIPAFAGKAAYISNVFMPPFNGSDPAAGSFITQSHPSSRQIQAPLSEQGWIIDGHPYGGAIGAGSAPICTLGSIGLQGGTTTVYKLVLAGGTCPATLDLKNFPLEVTAGRFILGDISSAAIGDQVTDSTPYRWCYARAANECRNGSSVGDIYASIPFGETGTACSFGNYDINAPCVFAKYGLVANIVQADVTKEDTTAAGTRRLGTGFTVPTHPNSYWSGTSDPDGQWVFFSPVFADNMVVNQYFAYKLPPTPPRDSVARNRYVDVPLTFNGVAGDMVRVRFGYAEFGRVDGSPNSLYCTSRAETCYTTASPTSANPFVFAGETQSYIACSPTCTVNVPALSNHVIYYLYERKNGSVSPCSVQAAVP